MRRRLSHGSTEPPVARPPPAAWRARCSAYVREHGGRRPLVLLNRGHDARTLDLAQHAPGARVLLSTHLDREEDVAGSVALRPDGGVVLELPG